MIAQGASQKAIDNNEDGYDVLSIIDAGDSRSLLIEVKTSTMGVAGFFHLTRNEWERSQEAPLHAIRWEDGEATTALVFSVPE